MQVIPVIDVMNTVVVYATGGERARYRPIETPLSRSADLVEVVDGLLTLHPFEILYVADLDGIAGHQPNEAALDRLRRAFPKLSIWVDDGSSSIAAIASRSQSGFTPVVGSETLPDAGALDAIRTNAHDQWLLSLDFKGSTFLGPIQVAREPSRWPPTVICMTLAAVGAKSGPELERVKSLSLLSPSSRIVAAGGVRDKADLIALSQAGAWGALVATALHTGTLKAGDLDEIAGLR